ncbi:MAG: PcfJ domain-containing protein, partial [Fibrella sp.]|nr:PcfJ domain-containing protein [Armatimonadota bacterium]
PFAMEPVCQRLGARGGNTTPDALLHFARFHAAWVRPPEEWIPVAKVSPSEQVGALAVHLFARWSLPQFLQIAWLSGFDEESETNRQWFVQLGGGGRLESLRFPLPMTHRAAHFFLQAPPHFSITSAQRYGQIRALGGTESLAQTLSETFLSETQPDEPFWLEATRFFLQHAALPLYQVGPICDFIRARRFGSDSPEPNFSLRGRTPETLLRRMAEWHEMLTRLPAKSRSRWETSGIEGWDEICNDPLGNGICRWQVVELTDSLALLEEGRQQRHCVRSYQDACVKGATAIFSLSVSLSSDKTSRRLLTIEVNRQRRAIVQVRGKCNQSVGAMRGNRRILLARDVLREWARNRRLSIACGV